MKNIINIVNFIRGCDPRADYDLKEAVCEQIKIAEKYNFPMTFLYQYDAMIQPEYVDLLKGKENFELGIWFELSRWITEKVGLKWRGRDGFDWDWHSCVDLTEGYTVSERMLLIDEAMRYFKETFGYYPKTVGSWVLDAFSVNYMYEKYDIDMVFICKEQWGTDGYSLWGGYYSEGYYPCRNNMLCPAQSAKEQINVPIFRMLGSDPVDQYMNGIGTAWQNVDSMEPVYPESGANKKWTEWFLNEVFDNRNAGLNYCQAGQENAFGWAAMKDGYTMQAELFEKARSQGKITFELAGETGRRFKKMYKNTPVSSTNAHKDGRSSFWYNSKYYRSSIYYNKGEILIRDLTIFDERYKERYLNDITTDESVFYDNLPLIDCFKWSDAENTGGMFFEYGGEIVSDAGDFKTVKNDDESISVAVPSKHGDIVISYKEKSVDFSFPKPGFVMKTVMYKGRTTVKEYAGGEVHCEYEGFKYKIGLRGAECLVHSGGFEFAVSGKSAGLVF